MLNSLFLILCVIFFQNSLKKKEILWPWKANGGEMPSFKMFQHSADLQLLTWKWNLTSPSSRSPNSHLGARMSSSCSGKCRPPTPPVHKWMNALRRSNLCKKLYSYMLKMKGGVGDEADFLSDAGRSQTTKHKDGNKQRWERRAWIMS